MTIVIISEPRDIHATSVAQALPKYGAQDVVLVDFSQFPTRMLIDQYLPTEGRDTFGLTLPDGRHLPLDAIRAVWWRRPQGYGVPNELAPHAREFALSETATAFQGMWQCSDCLWVNDIVRDAQASHKPWQLHLAKECGLQVPETLITNDPERVRRFLSHCRGEVVYKPFIQTFHTWRETRKLREAELPFLDSVRLAPVIFQRLIPGAFDLRVTVIGEEVLSAAVDLSKVEYQLDVRLNQGAYERHELPLDLRKRLLALMRRLGLEYGAIDLRLTPDGEYYFFEVNPAGQFLFIEHACELPITDTLARHLALGTRTRATAELSRDAA